MSRSKLLLDLQSIDSTSDAATAKRKRIGLALRGSKAEREAVAAFEAREAALAEAASALRKVQDERSAIQAKLEADSKSLYDDRRKSAREVQNLQLEVESLQRRLATLDGVALEAMEARDGAEGERDAAAKAKEAAQDLWARQRAALQAEDQRLEKALATLESQRKQLRAAMSPEDLARYDRLRTAKGGVAVAKLERGSCGACGRQITSEEQATYRSGRSEIHSCRGCGRILHT